MGTDDISSGTDESPTNATARVRYEWSEPDCPSTAVIEAVAATTDREPTTMPPLYDHIDPDALDAIMTARTNGTSNAITASFAYGGVTVRVGSTGWIDVHLDGTGHE